MISSIVLEINRDMYGLFNVCHSRYSWVLGLDHVVLLSQCATLKELRVIVDIRPSLWNSWSHLQMLEGVLRDIGRRTRGFSSTLVLGPPSIMELPVTILCFRVTETSYIKISGSTPEVVHHEHQAQLNKGRAIPDAVLQSHDFQGYLKAVGEAFDNRKRLIANEPHLSTRSFDTETIIRSTNVAHIDMPGYLRAGHDVSVETEGAISTRTRSTNLKLRNYDSFGILSDRFPKYSADGILQWDFNVTGVRWNVADIEFHAAFEPSLWKRDAS